MMPAPLRLFTLYWNPRDYPGRFVVRGFTIAGAAAAPDEVPIYVGVFLEAARRAILAELPGAVRLERSPEDEAQILEVWL